MKKIPFDIKYRPEIESGKYKVCDQTNREVRIICWDAINKVRPDQCIIALVKEDSDSDDENNRWFFTNGWGADRHYHLFILTDEPELTEFEEMLYSIFDAYNGLEIDVRAAVDVNAKTLLELAKKEICKGCTVGLEQYWKGREDARKEAEKFYTFHYPTYGPPCLHGGVCTNPMRDCINCPNHSSGTTINTTSGTCKND